MIKMMAKLTKSQQEVMENAIFDWAETQGVTFERWYADSEYCGHHGSYEEAVKKNYRTGAARISKNPDKYVAECVEFTKKSFNEMQSGIVSVYTSSNTLRALEKKGYIRIITDGKRRMDKVQLLCI